jgi:predicted ATP-dependent serine protease
MPKPQLTSSVRRAATKVRWFGCVRAASEQRRRGAGSDLTAGRRSRALTPAGVPGHALRAAFARRGRGWERHAHASGLAELDRVLGGLVLACLSWSVVTRIGKSTLLLQSPRRRIAGVALLSREERGPGAV